jgi:hypothetical protein
MVQSRGGPRLAAEALERKGIPGELIGKEFEGDKAAQLLVLRLVDNSHAAAAELFDDLVAGNPGSNHEQCRSLLEYAHGTKWLQEGQRRIRGWRRSGEQCPYAKRLIR